MLEKPTEYQSQLIERLLSRDFPGVESLREQAKHYNVENYTDRDGNGSFAIHPDKTLAPAADLEFTVPVEGVVEVSPPIEYLLHTSSGYITELEVVTYGENSVSFPIALEKIRVLTHAERVQYEKD